MVSRISAAGKMGSISGISCRTGLLLILLVCSFTRDAVGREVAAGDEVTEKFQDSGGASGAVGVDRMVVDKAGDDSSAQLSDHTEVGLCGLWGSFCFSLFLTATRLLGRTISEFSVSVHLQITSAFQCL